MERKFVTGVVLPTYNDKTKWYEMVIRFAESLPNISEVDNLVFLINYQNVDLFNPADAQVISTLESAIEETNPTWSLKGEIHSYDKPISMVKVRSDCILMGEDEVDLFLFIDDDVKFNKGAGECYNEIIDFFENDEKLGLVMSAGFLGGYNYKHQIKKALEKHWTVCRGLFLRNLKKYANKSYGVYPREVQMIHQGGYEEMIAAFEYVRLGYDLATHFNNPTTHKITTMDVDKDSKKDVRYTDDQIHNLERSFNSATDILWKVYDIDHEIKCAKDYQTALRLIYNKFH